MAEQKIDTSDPKFQRGGKLNKAAVMRYALQMLGKTATGQQVATWVKETFGIELLKSDMVSLYSLKNKPKGGKPGKPGRKPGVKPSVNGHSHKVETVGSNGHSPANLHKAVVAAINACGGKSELVEYVNAL